jgi:hypothetical protein
MKDACVVISALSTGYARGIKKRHSEANLSVM